MIELIVPVLRLLLPFCTIISSSRLYPGLDEVGIAIEVFLSRIIVPSDSSLINFVFSDGKMSNTLSPLS